MTEHFPTNIENMEGLVAILLFALVYILVLIPLSMKLSLKKVFS